MGDLHNKGYHCEAVFKEHGQIGLLYVVAEVMKRKQLTKEAFKNKKFQENYLSQIREAVRDTRKAYGIAACFDFKESTDFPTKRQLTKCKMESGSHNRILLEQFKSWAQKSKKSDKVFEHNLSLLMYHGPLLQLYDHALHRVMGMQENWFTNFKSQSMPNWVFIITTGKHSVLW